MRSSAASCAWPSLPVAIRGSVGTAEETPISATRPAPAQEREGGAAVGLVAAQIIVPALPPRDGGGADIGVVIAGNDGDVLRGADALQPRPRRREFRLQRQVDEIAGHRDVVGPLRPDVGDQRVQHLAAVVFVAVAGPVEIAERALAREIAQPRRRQRRQMRIRQMRQRECRPSSNRPALYWQARCLAQGSNVTRLLQAEHAAT